MSFLDEAVRDEKHGVGLRLPVADAQLLAFLDGPR